MIHNLKEKAEHIPFQKKTEKREKKKIVNYIGPLVFAYHVNTTTCVKCTQFTKNVRVHGGISGSYKYIKNRIYYKIHSEIIPNGQRPGVCTFRLMVH